MPIERLNPEQLISLARELPDWQCTANGDAISRGFLFSDFVSAFAFMTQVAAAAELHNHHPQWSNTYRRVNVVWTTHDVQGLTQLDVLMAKVCDRCFAELAQVASAPAKVP
jgi:4a-hydroxytetrahydrobiopterin dehydratase